VLAASLCDGCLGDEFVFVDTLRNMRADQLGSPFGQRSRLIQKEQPDAAGLLEGFHVAEQHTRACRGADTRAQRKRDGQVMTSTETARSIALPKDAPFSTPANNVSTATTQMPGAR
jgi:hypothetical protein